jgi:hypothetical protein
LVGISAAAAAYSLAQLLLIAHKALKNHVVPTRRYAWMLLAGDQVCQFLVILIDFAVSSYYLGYLCSDA